MWSSSGAAAPLASADRAAEAVAMLAAFAVARAAATEGEAPEASAFTSVETVG